MLPIDLQNAIKHLSDQEFGRLFSVVMAEQTRRGKKLPVSGYTPRRQQAEAPISLTRGQVNAVRAAYRAGISPSRIARQFGIPGVDVRKVLASDDARRR